MTIVTDVLEKLPELCPCVAGERTEVFYGAFDTEGFLFIRMLSKSPIHKTLNVVFVCGPQVTFFIPNGVK
jgi:hypothetical protein